MTQDLTPIDVLLTTAGQVPDSDNNGPGTIIGTYLARVPEVPAPKEKQFQAELEQLTAGEMPGSLAGLLPDPLYVFSTGHNPEMQLKMAKLHYARSLYIVSNEVKDVLETLTIRNSEFHPVTMVYSTKGVDNVEDWGGGDVVPGTHWLWWCFASYDLVDVVNTQAKLTPLVEQNKAVPEKPSVSFYHLGRPRNAPPITVALQSLPYAESAAFTILGWSSAPMAVSPAFVAAFAEAGLLEPDGPIRINPLPLEGQRYAQANNDFRKKTIAQKPPLRVAGTQIIAADQYDPPFYSRRLPIYALPVQEV